MSDFVAGSLAAAVFCLGFTALNALTRLAGPFAPDDFCEAGLLQYGLSGLLAYAAWRRVPQIRGGPEDTKITLVPPSPSS